MRLAVDFEQPRNLYTTVMSQTDREHLIHNIAAHLGNAKSAEIRARQRMSSFFRPMSKLFVDDVTVSVFAAVDQGLSDAIAKVIGAPAVRPLRVAPASGVVPLRTNIGQRTVTVA